MIIKNKNKKIVIIMNVKDWHCKIATKNLYYGRRQRPGIRSPAMRINELLQISVQILEDQVEEGLPVLVDVLDAEQTATVNSVPISKAIVRERV